MPLPWWFIFASVLVVGGCAVAYQPDPRGTWRMQEWRTLEGEAFRQSRERPWSQRLDL